MIYKKKKTYLISCFLFLLINTPFVCFYCTVSCLYCTCCRYLKEKKPCVRVVLADPEGSSLFHRVKHGVCYTVQQAEKGIKKHRHDSIVEGVGLDRITSNFQLASINDAEKINDQEILDTAHWLLREEGLFVGSSSAMNVTAACRVAMNMPENSLIVTIICDNGQRHLSRFWNPDYIKKYNLSWPPKDIVPESMRFSCPTILI